MRSLRFVGALGAVLALAVSTHGASVMLVGGNVGGEDEEALRNLIISLGHLVPEPVQLFNNGPPTAADLGETDLIIVTRSQNSGNVDEGTEPADWNLLDKPLILMSPQVSRGLGPGGNSRWGWLNLNATVDNQDAPPNFDAFPNPSHPFVAGRTTSIFPDDEDVTIDYVNATSAEVPSGATIVATMSVTTDDEPPENHTFASIVDYPAGTTLFADTQGTFTVTTARRALFQMWEYPDVAERAFELSANGAMILDQMITTMAPTTTVPGDVNGNGTTDINDYNIIRMNMFGTGKTRAQGDVTGDGTVDFADFRHWKNFRGATAGAGAGGLASVPEPGTISLVLFGALALAAASRRQAR